MKAKYRYKVDEFSLPHVELEQMLNYIARDGCRIVCVDWHPGRVYITKEYEIIEDPNPLNNSSSEG